MKSYFDPHSRAGREMDAPERGGRSHRPKIDACIDRLHPHPKGMKFS